MFTAYQIAVVVMLLVILGLLVSMTLKTEGFGETGVAREYNKARDFINTYIKAYQTNLQIKKAMEGGAKKKNVLVQLGEDVDKIIALPGVAKQVCRQACGYKYMDFKYDPSKTPACKCISRVGLKYLHASDDPAEIMFAGYGG